MTDPAPSTDPAANDPANPDPANPTADPANPTDPPAGPADPAETEDARVKRANSEAAKYRTERNALQQQLEEQGKTLAALAAVFNPGSEADPAEQLSNITTEAETLRGRTAQLEAELLVHNLAGTNGANPSALLDSRAFVTKLHGLDPAAADYAEQVTAAIKDALAKNTSLAASAPAPSRGGAPGAGQGSEQPAGAVTAEEFAAMSYKDRAQLFRTNPDLYRRLAG